MRGPCFGESVLYSFLLVDGVLSHQGGFTNRVTLAADRVFDQKISASFISPWSLDHVRICGNSWEMTVLFV